MENKAILTGIQWRKSSYSGDQGGNCIEVAELPGAIVAVRDSKTPAGPTLSVRPDAFRRFVSWSGATPEV